jgi:hypothetical protein
MKRERERRLEAGWLIHVFGGHDKEFIFYYKSDETCFTQESVYKV